MNDPSSAPRDFNFPPPSNPGSGFDAPTAPAPVLPAQTPLPVVYSLPREPPLPLATSVAEMRLPESSPEALQREELLDQVQRQRTELIDVAHRLRGPAQTLQTAQRAISLTVRTARWIPLAVNLLSIAMWLKSGRRRPPLTLIVGATLQLVDAWSDLNKRPKSAAPRPHPRAASRPESRMRLPEKSPP